MLKHKEKASGGIIQGRQGLDYKFQDLTARILLGGRTDMQNYENSGALKRNRQSGTVDLGSNGCRCARVSWTAP
jgi:hypothetical protein